MKQLLGRCPDIVLHPTTSILHQKLKQLVYAAGSCVSVDTNNIPHKNVVFCRNDAFFTRAGGGGGGKSIGRRWKTVTPAPALAFVCVRLTLLPNDVSRKGP